MIRYVPALALLAACASEPPPPDPSGLAGATLTQARPKPAFTLLSTTGGTYSFRDSTQGKLTYLFFGYTHCPDICPMHMANLAAVLKTLDYDQREQIRVVFVTTDPQRDSLPRLRTWLDNFDRRFVGLTGRPADVNAILNGFGLPPSQPEAAPAGSPAGEYGVGHAAVVLAFTPDDSLRVFYPFGTRQQDFAKDIPLLLQWKARG